MRGLAICCVLVGAFAGCDASAEAEARLLCSTICRCLEVPLPARQEACINNCSNDDDIQLASQSCAECIFTHADRCGSLTNDCDVFCDQPDPPNELGDVSRGEDR